MNIRTAAVRILNSYHHQYFNYENKIAATSDGLKLSGKDRDFLYILVKGVILHRSYLDFVIEIAAQRSVKKFENTVLNLLRVGVFQYLILETPPHAFTNETVDAARQLKKPRAIGLINAVLRHLLLKDELKTRLAELPDNESLAIQFSHPQWMIDRWIEHFGIANTQIIADFNNSYQKIYFRHNPVKISWDDLSQILKDSGYTISVAIDSPILFFSTDTPGELIRSELFNKGFMSVQDISQSLAVRLLNPQPGEVIIDACAAPGGKTGMIAQLGGRESIVNAYDISPAKVQLLKNEAFRLGLDFVNYGVADARSGTFPMADKVLLDVPCSGTGVMARRADLRWNRTPQDLETLLVMQREILTNMVNAVKPGGVVIYSTCSIEPEENWQNIEWFLEANPDFTIESADNFVEAKWCDKNGAVQVLPHLHNETGGFAVRLQRR
ncbi:16S rRNA (cytosine(967)-C(5))-methyltransferase RsmB [bacterium]|nr:16S rRNA (cytosine(967)-C(5))-methyltransferase RsmB [bacterium]MBU1065855.1 16S rRNA (cytosine(967)-C(5))-methyltransferase RsmB [bacterium]MBU1634178.1 16S rRNA (cytosine(967)-C(5))-methyltransferase RsmB [bacterium]MBU1872797.1 16S rRNA (cytosine(967)-C(5))-methyltransferase RsmB [bacterium]